MKVHKFRDALTALLAALALAASAVVSGVLSTPAHSGTPVSGPVFDGKLRDGNGNVIAFPGSPTPCYLYRNSVAGTNGITALQRPVYLFAIQVYNARTTAVYLRIYNSANPTGVDPTSIVPNKIIYLEPQKTSNIQWSNGLYFSTGLAFGLSTDNTAVTTSGVAAADIQDLNFDCL